METGSEISSCLCSSVLLRKDLASRCQDSSLVTRSRVAFMCQEHGDHNGHCQLMEASTLVAGFVVKSVGDSVDPSAK